MFKLVENWKDVAARSHSMRGFYLTGIFLLLPELIFLLAGVDTNPRYWWIAACVAWLYGMFGRVIDQGIDLTRLRSPWLIGVVLLFVGAVVALGDWRGVNGVSAPVPPPDVRAETMPASDADFLRLAVPFVGGWEGKRLSAYRDIVGVWTVCYGHTQGVRPGDSYTAAECDAMLARDLLTYRAGWHRYLTPETRSTRLPVTRDVAYSSLAINVGIAGAGKSTATRRLNAGDIVGGCEALTWWNKAGGRVIRGLVRRRSEERTLCLEGVA